MLQRHNVGYASTCNSVGQVWIYIKLIECYRVVLMWRHKWFRLYDPFTPHILCPKNFDSLLLLRVWLRLWTKGTWYLLTWANWLSFHQMKTIDSWEDTKDTIYTNLKGLLNAFNKLISDCRILSWLRLLHGSGELQHPHLVRLFILLGHCLHGGHHPRGHLQARGSEEGERRRKQRRGRRRWDLGSGRHIQTVGEFLLWSLVLAIDTQKDVLVHILK